MVFSSSLFLFIFLPITIFGYYFCNIKFRNIWLLLASLVFYSWGEPKYIFLMLLSIVINYFLGKRIEKSKKYKKILLIMACIINLGILIIFKYSNFIVSNIDEIFEIGIDKEKFNLPMIIGISFYTFQILSYIIDVYRGNVKAQRNILNLGLYISLFPQLIAGPIVRYIDVEKQIEEREHSIQKFSDGIEHFMIGFLKKVLIADRTAAIADLAFNTKVIDFRLAWLGIIAYTIQIYFDFSGYSEMAIGLGKMFGFDFMENFNYPYISQSIREFWRRWHISLGSWFRDYVYIPLGGSKRGKLRTYVNTLIVFFLTGFWHGASWNFIVWGIYYAIFIIGERIFENQFDKIPRALKHIYTVIIVLIGWIFFRADNLTLALNYIKNLFNFDILERNVCLYQIKNDDFVFLILGIIFSAPLFNIIFRKIKQKGLYRIIISVGFMIGITYMVGNGFSPFLYFRF